MKGEVIRRRQAVTIRRYATRKLVNAAGVETGFTTDFDKFTDTAHDVEIEINIEGLFRRLGEKAARSISGQSRAVDGLVVARRMRPVKP